MSLKARSVPPVCEETAEVARAAFPQGNVYMQMRDEFGSIYTDDVFADLYAKDGQPAVSPWQLALVTVMQFAENLSDRQAAEAVRARIDWKYALSLDLSDAGFDYSVLSEFRKRLVEYEDGQLLLDTMLARFRETGLLKARGQQRTDSTHVVAAVRELNRLENVGQTLRHALNSLASVEPEWLVRQVTPEWYERYGPRFEQYRLPKSEKEQQELAASVGQDGYHLLRTIYEAEEKPWLRDLPAVDVLRQVWVQQFWCDNGQVRLRTVKDMPPVGDWIRSPFDIEARYCTKGQTGWVGYKVHMTETCDPDRPHLITQVKTTKATLQDSLVTGIIQDELAAVDLLPAEHLVDAGYVNGPQLVHSQQTHGVRLIGPAPPDTSWQALSDGLRATEFTVDWDARRVTCPPGHRSITWQPSHSQRGQPVIRVLFAREVCQACSLRKACTRGQARGLTLRPRDQHEALQAARQREQTEEFKETYRKRAGIEGTISQATRTTGMRRSRYIGLDKTHLQNLASAAAINLARVVNWSNDIPFAATRTSRFAALAA
jgi:transposase